MARLGELMTRFLPRPPARVLGMGGRTGRDASYLAGLGYEVAWSTRCRGIVQRPLRRAAAVCTSKNRGWGVFGAARLGL
jgi:hypothetical protein